jgi:FkbM family methyltransferase
MNRPSIAGSLQNVGWRIRRGLQRLGVDVVPYSASRHPLARRAHLFGRNGVELVLDVGANAGQYGRFLRRTGYRGRILSFEPLSSAFAALSEAARGDAAWEVRRAALGERAGTATINIAKNSESSSLLPVLPAHLRAFPDSEYVGTETVPVTTLADVLREIPPGPATFLKVDTQGYERSVIAGGDGALERLCGVQLEMSLVPLYEGELRLPELINFMKERGFTLMSVEPGGGDPETGQLLWIDGLFFRG